MTTDRQQPHPLSRRRRRIGRWKAVSLVPWGILLLAIADWVALRIGLLHHTPAVLAWLVALAMAALLVRGAVCIVALARRRRPAAGAEALLIAGLLTALGAGAANWLLGLQGFVVLHEGERVPLADGRHLVELTGGPLARIGEIDLVLGLEEVELRPVGPAGTRGFVPRSRLLVERPGAEPRRVAVEPRHLAAVGPLRLHQGAFGFAPRIVIERDGETVFDRVVPFTTERRDRDGVRGVSFEGVFTLARESLRVDGRVDLASLDAALRGHATLHLAVRRDGELLGRGRLLPGHFAEIGDGYRVGFTGLERWSEIDLSRRGYGEVLLGGAAVAGLGLLALPLAWRWER